MFMHFFVDEQTRFGGQASASHIATFSAKKANVPSSKYLLP